MFAKILFYDTTAISQVWFILWTQHIVSKGAIVNIKFDVITTNCFRISTLQNKLQKNSYNSNLQDCVVFKFSFLILAETKLNWLGRFTCWSLMQSRRKEVWLKEANFICFYILLRYIEKELAKFRQTFSKLNKFTWSQDKPSYQLCKNIIIVLQTFNYLCQCMTYKNKQKLDCKFRNKYKLSAKSIFKLTLCISVAHRIALK